MLDPKTDFLACVDEAIQEARQVIEQAENGSNSWMLPYARSALDYMIRIRIEIQEGSLPKSNGAGLGLSRSLGEWDAPANLIKAGAKVDGNYMENWD